MSANTDASFFKNAAIVYADQANKDRNSLNSAANKYTGNAGYQNSINQGKIGAQEVAKGAQAQSTTAARNAGMTRSQAAAMGSQQNAAAYLNGFSDQQNKAYQAGMDNVSVQKGKYDNSMNAMNSFAGQYAGQKQAQVKSGNELIGAGVTAAGSALAALSDHNLKKDVIDVSSTSADKLNNYRKVSKKVKYHGKNGIKLLKYEINREEK